MYSFLQYFVMVVALSFTVLHTSVAQAVQTVVYVDGDSTNTAVPSVLL